MTADSGERDPRVADARTLSAEELDALLEGYVPNRMPPWRNNKTGMLYCVVCTAIDSTNVRDGAPVIVYRRATAGYANGQQVFVRERGEFLEKFSVVLPDAVLHRAEDQP
jgi:hypothetical protein